MVGHGAVTICISKQPNNKMSEQETRLAESLDQGIVNAAKQTNNPWVALFAGILLKHGIYGVAIVCVGFMYMEKDKTYQTSRDLELDRYINIIQKHTTATERSNAINEQLYNWLQRHDADFRPPNQR